MVGSDYSASRVLASSPKYLLLASVRSRILNPTELSSLLCEECLPVLPLIPPVNSFVSFSSQWGLPALSVLEAPSAGGTWQWELLGRLWRAPRVSGTLLLIPSPPTWKVLLHLRHQSCPKRRSWRWVYPRGKAQGNKSKANPDHSMLVVKRVASKGGANCFQESKANAVLRKAQGLFSTKPFSP